MSGIMAKKMADKPTPGDTPDPNAPEVENAADQAAEPQGEPSNEPVASASNTPAGNAPVGSADNATKPADASSQGEQASPASQAAYEKVVLAGMKVIFDDKSNQQVLQTLQQGDRPDTALANVTVSIITELDRQSQGKIPEDVIIPAAMEILSELGDVAQKAGLFEVDDSTMTGAAQQTVMKLLEQYGVQPQAVQAVMAKLDPAKVKQMVADQQKSAQGWAGQASTQASTDQADQAQPAPPQGGIMQQPGAPA